MNASLFNSIAAAGAAAALLGLVGCKATDAIENRFPSLAAMHDSIPWLDDGDAEPRVPIRVTSNWTSDYIQYQPGKVPQRGFGGRLYFYGKQREDPIAVEGQLVVYAYDESNRDQNDSKPTRKYAFPPEILAELRKETSIGQSYSIWIPWDEQGGPKCEVSLVCRFEPKDGPVVIGDQMRLLLTGSDAPLAAKPGQPAPKAGASGVVQAAYLSADGAAAAPQTGNTAGDSANVSAPQDAATMQTVTIPLPNSMVPAANRGAAPAPVTQPGGAITPQAAALPQAAGANSAVELPAIRSRLAMLTSAPQQAANIAAATPPAGDLAATALDARSNWAPRPMNRFQAAVAGQNMVPGMPAAQLPTPQLGALNQWNSRPAASAAPLVQQKPTPSGPAQIQPASPATPAGSTSGWPSAVTTTQAGGAPAVTVGPKQTTVQDASGTHVQ